MSGDEVGELRGTTAAKTIRIQPGYTGRQQANPLQLPYQPLRVCTTKRGTKEGEAVTGIRFPTAL